MGQNHGVSCSTGVQMALMKVLQIVLLSTCLFFSGQMVANDSSRFLQASGNLALQQALEGVVLEQDLASAVDEHKLALVLLIVTDPERPRLAELNGHTMLYAASLPKIAILLGAAVAIDDGRLELNQELQDDLDNMIRYSCNACATKVLEQVGREELLAILRSPRFEFYNQNEKHKQRYQN